MPRAECRPNSNRTPHCPTSALPVQGALSYRLAITDCITHQAVQRHSCSTFARFVLSLELHAGARGIFPIVYPDPTGIHPWRRVEDGVGWGSATGLFAVVFWLNQYSFIEQEGKNRRWLDSNSPDSFSWLSVSMK